MTVPQDVTALLAKIAAGDPCARRDLFDKVYGELRSLAGRLMRGERAGHTLQATALVHEAYLRLLGPEQLQLSDRGHVIAVAARAMRQILVEHARKRDAKKRGGDWDRQPFSEIEAPSEAQGVDLLALDEALDDLAEYDTRKAQIVELRFFAGLTGDEIAEKLAIDTRTVERDWKFAQAWLARRMDGGREASPGSDVHGSDSDRA